ncbi:hypothetical protein ONS95_005221 [Cadophora gregata]|uniref:uncharacterized protein n=1 Tax=Cadophora gregata TaxID=51156 RepID=UPI0026DC9F22|nr:uncharacterized protein ONS95_005221 [Cadophora gregata]KAK0104960.1 hypothetical protein ONS95_005221 [Cadophora gregata]
MATLASGLLHVQPRSQYPPPPPLPPGYFDYLPRFVVFPKLPLEVHEIIWKLCLPFPHVFHASGNIFCDPFEERHIVTFSVLPVDSSPEPTPDGCETYKSRVLSMSRACKESRAVYLKAFPISSPVEMFWDADKLFNAKNRGLIKSRLYLSQEDRLFMVNMEELVANPWFGEALGLEEWTAAITTRYRLATSMMFAPIMSVEEAFHALMWSLFKAFPNLKEFKGVVLDGPWYSALEDALLEEDRSNLKSLRCELKGVKSIHG